MLSKEVNLRQARNIALSKQLEIYEVEGNLKQAIAQAEKDMVQTNINCDNITQDENAWDAKIDNKRVELDRTEKRFPTD
jgi:hypothetical protein